MRTNCTLPISMLVALALTAAGTAPACAQPSVCPSDTDGAAGAVVYIAILIDNPVDIGAFGLDLEFDPTVFQYESALPSELTAQWVAFDGSEIAPGTARLGGFHNVPIAVTTPDTLGYICMSVAQTATTSTYTAMNFVDDIAGAPNCSGDFNLVNPVEAASWGDIKQRYRAR